MDIILCNSELFEGQKLVYPVFVFSVVLIVLSNTFLPACHVSLHMNNFRKIDSIWAHTLGMSACTFNTLLVPGQLLSYWSALSFNLVLNAVMQTYSKGISHILYQVAMIHISDINTCSSCKIDLAHECICAHLQQLLHLRMLPYRIHT